MKYHIVNKFASECDTCGAELKYSPEISMLNLKLAKQLVELKHNLKLVMEKLK